MTEIQTNQGNGRNQATGKRKYGEFIKVEKDLGLEMEVLDGDGRDRRGRSRRKRVAEKMAGTGKLKRFEEALIGWVWSWGVGRTTLDEQLVRLISFCKEFMYPSYYDFFFSKTKFVNFIILYPSDDLSFFSCTHDDHHVVILSIPLYQ